MLKIDLARSAIVKSLMRALIIIETEISPQSRNSIPDRLVVFQKDLFVLNRSPESLYKDIVKNPASAIHANANPSLVQDGGKIKACELRTLIGIKYIGPRTP